MPADKQQLTPWFDGSVKPARNGEYERRIMLAPDRWSGRERVKWSRGHWFILAADGKWSRSLFQPHVQNGSDFQWRGLKEPSK